MDVKFAVKLAIEQVIDLFGRQDVLNVALEEVDFNEDKDEWLVTVGFNRPWDMPKHQMLADLGAQSSRQYKVVRIDSDSGGVKAIKNRD